MEFYIYVYNTKTHQIGRIKEYWSFIPNLFYGIKVYGDELRMALLTDDQNYFIKKVKEYIEAEKKKAKDTLDAMTYAIQKIEEYQKTTLLPCPLCGGKVGITSFYPPTATIRCLECNLSICAETESRAIEKWNRRVKK